MTRSNRRHTASSASRIASSIAAILVILAMASLATAQNPDWRVVDNPYQEDIEYDIGATHQPGVEVEGIRWRLFKIETPVRDPFAGGDPVRTELTLELENRRTTNVKVLVIFLLEDEDGNPLDRIEVKPFKVPSGRLKEKREVTALPPVVIDSTQRVYVFFEIME